MISYTLNNININIEKKNVKNLNIKVNPDMQVYVSCPQNIDIDLAKKMVFNKSSWIEKQISILRTKYTQEKREYVSGEDHYYNGRRYILKVFPVENKSVACVKLENKKFINMYVSKNATIDSKDKLMNDFYKDNLKKKVNNYLEKWSSILNVEAKEFKLRKMKNRWGSCNLIDKTILLNTELAKKSDQAIEYVVVHELLHLIEWRHNDNFYSLLDYYYPRWRNSREMLNES